MPGENAQLDHSDDVRIVSQVEIVNKPAASLPERLYGEDWQNLGFDVDELDEFADALFSECKDESQLSSLETASSFLRDIYGSRATDHPYYTDSLKNLALALVIEFIWRGQISALDDAVNLLEDASELATRVKPESDPVVRQGLQHAVAPSNNPLPSEDEQSAITHFALSSLTEFCQAAPISSIDSVIFLLRQVVQLRGISDTKRLVSIHRLTNALVLRHFHARHLQDLDEAVLISQEALHLQPSSHRYQLQLLGSLLAALLAKFISSGQISDLAEAIRVHAQQMAMRSDLEALRQVEQGSTFLQRFRLSGHIEDLTTVATLLRKALSMLRQEHPERHQIQGNLAVTLFTLFEQNGRDIDLQECIEINEDLIRTVPIAHPDRSGLLNNLANARWARFEQKGQVDDLEKAILFHRDALALRPSLHRSRAQSLSNLANVLWKRFEDMDQIDDLEEAISLRREITTLRSLLHPGHSQALSNLASALSTRFERKGQIDDLDEAIDLYRRALLLSTALHPQHSNLLNSLGRVLSMRFQQTGQMIDLEEAISNYRQTITLRPVTHPDRSLALNNLASALLLRFKQKAQANDIEEAVSLHREALSFCSGPHPERPTSLNDLASVLLTRFAYRGEAEDLQEAISLYREALMLRPAQHPDRFQSFHNLAHALMTRFEQHGGGDDLDEAISFHREAFTLLPPSRQARSSLLNNLATVLLTRFMRLGQACDLEEAVLLLREALLMTPASHPDRPDCLNNLASALLTQFEQHGRVNDLDEAIILVREALMLRSAQHLDYSNSLHNLGYMLSTRFELKIRADDLEEAIVVYRKALDLRPASHPDRAQTLNNLANVLSTRFEQKGQAGDLEEAISFHKDALMLFPAPHPSRPHSLNNLGSVFLKRFNQKGQDDNLEDAILYFRETLMLLPATNPGRPRSLHNLAHVLATRFRQKGHIDDLEEAISLQQEALTYIPGSHPDRCWFLATSASYLCLKPDSPLLDTAMSSFRAAVTSEPGPMLARLRAAQMWARYADDAKHASALEAYQTTIQLFPRVAMLASDITSRHQLLADRLGRRGFVGDATACAIRLCQFDQAVEMLEEGRSIFWSQALRLRTSFDDLHLASPELAQKLQYISRALERTSFHQGSSPIRGDTQAVMTMEAEAVRFRQLNEEWSELLEQVRALKDFEDFLRPKKLASIKIAAARGPIVLLTANNTSCDALIVTSTGVEHVPLSAEMTSRNVVVLVNSMRSVVFNRFGSFADEFQASLEALLAKAQTARHIKVKDQGLGRRRIRQSKTQSTDDIFRSVLATLWTFIVQPVIRCLKLERSTSPPRVWWCSTGLLALLPIHAAGIYDTEMGPVENASDYMVSSYAPTLSSLLVPPPAPTTDSFKMLVAIQPVTQGHTLLPQTREEMRQIERHVPASSLVKLGGNGSPSSGVETVLSHLSEASISHLACHGIQDLDSPLESAVLLDDGPLKISRIMTQPLPNASLIFLSACQTAMGDANLPDEAFHLAATMLFSGFRGVVATMWSIYDDDGPKIANEFYGHLFRHHSDGSSPDTTEAARALHLAVNQLRAEYGDGSFVRWVPFVHYGL